MVKKDNAPEILSLIRRVVINMLSLDTTQPSFTKKKLSKRQKRKFANWDEGIMRSILGVATVMTFECKGPGIRPAAWKTKGLRPKFNPYAPSAISRLY